MHNISTKRLQIDKDSKTMIIWVAIAVFIVIFSIISGHSLYTELSYRNRVIAADSTAYNQLKNDVNTSGQLVGSYKDFVDTSTNIIGGSTNNNSQNNGDNAKIILDALPSTYDYPALIASLQSLLGSQGVTINSITGTDSPPGPSSGLNSSAPIAMPFSFSVSGSFQSIQNVVSAFEHSIRPMQFQTVDISGSQSSLTLNVSAQTYFQPAIGFNIKKEIVQ